MRYRFSARSVEGEIKTGFLEALDPTDARQQLERRKLLLLQLNAEEAPAQVHVAPKADARPSLPVPKPVREPGLWSQIDRRKAATFLALLVFGLTGVLWLGGRMLGQKLYRIQLTGHLTLISKQELDANYTDRIQLGLRLQNPAWQISRDGTIAEKENGEHYQRRDGRAQVQFEINVEGDYRYQAEVDLPGTPTSVRFFIEAPGFSDRWMDVKLTPGKEANSLVGAVPPMTVKRQKRRPSIVGGKPAAPPTPVVAAPALPKYDPDAPEPAE